MKKDEAAKGILDGIVAIEGVLKDAGDALSTGHRVDLTMLCLSGKRIVTEILSREDSVAELLDA